MTLYAAIFSVLIHKNIIKIIYNRKKSENDIKSQMN